MHIFLKRIFLLSIVFLFILITIFNLPFFTQIYIPQDMDVAEIQTEYSYKIKQGVGSYQVASDLYDKDIIRNPILFKLLSRKKIFKTGEYTIHSKDTIYNLFKKFENGDVKLNKITFPEGVTQKKIVEILAKNGFTEKLSKDIKEGDLYPDTYFFAEGISQEKLVKELLDKQKDVIKDLWLSRASNLEIKTKEAAMVLASIIEKETLLKAEKPIVASVFYNRLKKGMKLQADSTVVYFITDGLGDMKGKKLYNKHLQTKNPYNTYMNHGLPPGPISSVGEDALRAALNPAETDYLYFVADGKGGHIFAKTYKEHNKNVQKWRQKQRRYNLNKIKKELKKKN